jgi:hypothetical protein
MINRCALLRLGILPTGFIYPKQMRAVRDVLRLRLLLVKQKISQLLSLQSTISRHTGQRLTSPKVKQLTPDDIATYLGDPAGQFSSLKNYTLLHQLRRQIDSIETFVISRCDPNAKGIIIPSTPGIGKILGMTILLETGPIERFNKVSNYSFCSRCVPLAKISNGKTKGHGNTKNGNRYLAMALAA